MADERSDRLVPDRLAHQFIHAAAAEIGEYSLVLMLRKAGLDRLVARGGLVEYLPAIRAAEFAALQGAMCEYFGRGARGTLNRIGRKAWLMLEEKAPFGQKARRWLISLLPRGTRARLALEDLAREMSGAGGRVSVHLLDIDLYLIDRTSDVTFGRKSAEPICWTTVGLIQEALQRGSGMEYDIEETDCRAVGAEACKFRIRK